MTFKLSIALLAITGIATVGNFGDGHAAGGSTAELAFPVRAEKILFLGDSITHDGHYISVIEAQLRLAGFDSVPRMLNLGLPSETCSGLSEPDHPFPRPNVHERIERAVEKIQPDVVVACYGMNDGIYYPLDDDRFAAFRKGIDLLIDRVHASGAKLVLMTPPPFDPLPLRKQGKLLASGATSYSWKTVYEDYDEVMKAYAEHVLAQRDRVELVVDLHSAVSEFTRAERRQDPQFTISPDGVHLDHQGHEILADAILKAWGVDQKVEPDKGLMSLIIRRQKILHDAWLSEVGHQRPGVKAGLPMDEALAEANEAGKQIVARVAFQRDEASLDGGAIHRVHFSASSKPGELPLFADYFLWVPPETEVIRGVIVHQHGCGAGACSAGLTAAADWHWRELAKKWNCALMGSSYESRVNQCRDWCDPRNGSHQRFLQALDHFANTTGHDELAFVPWCLWGHSGGGFWASLMQTLSPERIVGIWLQSGTAYSAWQKGEIVAPTLSDAVYDVPVMGCPGLEEKDHQRFRGAWTGLHDMLRAYRVHDAPFGIAPDPKTGHECGDARYLAIAFFDECLKQRLPTTKAPSAELREIDPENSRLVSLENRQILPVDSTGTDPSQYAWLPSEAFANKWSQFVTSGFVDDTTAPPKVTSLQATRSTDGVWLSWNPVADFESGLRGFRVIRDGNTVAELPDKPVGRFGRPIFQTMSYSDTPELPLPQPVWLDESQAAHRASKYEVISVNAAGLESQPVEIVFSE